MDDESTLSQSLLNSLPDQEQPPPISSLDGVVISSLPAEQKKTRGIPRRLILKATAMGAALGVGTKVTVPVIKAQLPPIVDATTTEANNFASTLAENLLRKIEQQHPDWLTAIPAPEKLFYERPPNPLPDHPPKLTAEYLLPQNTHHLIHGLEELYREGKIKFTNQPDVLPEEDLKNTIAASIDLIRERLKESTGSLLRRVSQLNPRTLNNNAIVTDSQAVEEIGRRFSSENIGLTFVPPFEEKTDSQGEKYQTDPQLELAIRRRPKEVDQTENESLLPPLIPFAGGLVKGSLKAETGRKEDVVPPSPHRFSRRNFLKLAAITVGSAAAMGAQKVEGAGVILDRLSPEEKAMVERCLRAVNKIPILATREGTQIIKDASGMEIGELYNTRREWVSLADAPPFLIQAVVSTEDRSFFTNPGIDSRGLARAIKSNLLNETSQGASTITQQLIKYLAFTPQELVQQINHPSLRRQRKKAEIIAALVFEKELANRLGSKEKAKRLILETYMNIVPMGSNIEGFGTAAKIYFNKPIGQLTAAEATYLTGLPQNPARYYPYAAKDDRVNGTKNSFRLADNHPGRQRQIAVLDSLVADGHITAEEKEEIFNQEITIIKPDYTEEVPLGYKEYVSWQLHTKLADTGNSNIEITTSLDTQMQKAVEEIVDQYRQELVRRDPNANSISVVVYDPETGEIKAISGFPYVDMLAGSTVKPITYAAALEQGLLKPDATVSDEELIIRTDNGAVWPPTNFGGKISGKQYPWQYALGHSLNVPAVREMVAIGNNRFAEMAKRLGLIEGMPLEKRVWSNTLGNFPTNLSCLAEVYGAFLNKGKRLPWQTIKKIYAPENKQTLYEAETREISVLDPRVAKMIREALSDEDYTFPAFHGLDGIFVKTGTSSNADAKEGEGGWDALTIGGGEFPGDKKYIVAVHITNGDDDGRPYLPRDAQKKPLAVHSTGLTVAAPLFKKIIQVLKG